jgi:hypothetical protein
MFQKPIETATSFPQNNLEQNNAKSKILLGIIPIHVYLIEWVLIFLMVFLFSYNYLATGPDYRLPGSEQVIFQSFGQILMNGFKQGYFPLWNPYVSTGFPYIADPMLYVYNPFIVFPILLFGYVKGFTYAVFIGMLIGAYGMWWLARQFDLGGVGRIWAALMFVFAGGLSARFIQGHYLLVIGYCWMPWVIGAIWRALHTGKGQDIGFAAATFALLYLCGNLYFAYYMIFATALAILAITITIKRERPFFNFNLPPIRTIIMIAVLTAGLTAVALIPFLEFSPRINKATNPESTDSHSIQQILLDYTSRDINRADTYQKVPPEDFYAYIGWWPFLALIWLPFSWKKANRRAIVFIILLFIFTIIWIDIRDMPWKELYRTQPLLNQFRYPTRMLTIGTLSIVLLGAFGLDTVWNRFLSWRQMSSKNWLGSQAKLLLGCTLLFMVASIGDVFYSNRKLNTPIQIPSAPAEILSKLRAYDLGTYYISAPPNWHEYTINANMRYWDAWYPIGDYIRYEGMINRRGFVAAPKYKILPVNNPAPENSIIVANTAQYSVYKLNNSLPFSFGTPNNTLETDVGKPLQPSDVIEQNAITLGPNQVAMTVSNDGTPATLVMLIEKYPGWQVTIDNQSAQLLNVSGYMGVAIQPGQHRYIFKFQPVSFYIGLVISLISCLILLVLFTNGKIFQITVYKMLSEKIKAISWLRTPKIVKQPSPIVVEKEAQIQNAAKPQKQFLEISAAESRQVDKLFTLTSRAGEEIKVQVTLNMPAGTRVRLTVEVLEGKGEIIGQPITLDSDSLATETKKTFSQVVEVSSTSVPATKPESILPAIQPSEIWERIRSFITSHKISLSVALFTIGIGIYLFTRLYALEYFPIYFFGDEAVQTLYAERLINNNFIDANGMGIPIYVEAAPNRWTPLVPMYFHAASVLLFGKSILETRATSAIISLVAVVSISLILKYIFNKRYWWAGILVASAIPAWFLHSRTAFETVMSTSFYAAFLLFYLLYRYKDPRYIYGALVFAALTFYSYSNAQVVMATAGLLLLLSDFKYHLENWRVLLRGLLLALVLAIPIINFEMKQPNAIGKHLETVNSYWYTNVPLTQKLGTFIQQYSYGLSPSYWVLPNTVDLSRHRMDTMGQLGFWILPFIILGILLSIRFIKEPKYRTIILALMATPVGGALLQISITRVLTFIVPVSILAVLGFEWLIEQAQKRWGKLPEKALQLGLFVMLSIASLWMLHTALVDGPLWEKDYGLYGMQWGAKQLFVDTIPGILDRDPKARVLVTSTWANGPDNFLSFFVKPADRARVAMSGVQTYLTNYTPMNGDEIFVLTPNEYQDVVNSKKFNPIKIEQILNYPDGKPGFYFVRLTYVEGVEKIFAEEKISRLTPVEVQTTIDGQAAIVLLSRTDAGQLSDAMDGNLSTLMRGKEANPFFLEFDFSKPRSMSGLALDFSAFDYKVTYDLYAPGSETPIHYEAEQHDVHLDSHVEVKFDRGPAEVQKIIIRITNSLLPPDQANIHIREIKFLP